MITQTEPKTTREEVQLMGEHLVTTLKKLIHEGSVRRIIIKLVSIKVASRSVVLTRRSAMR